MTETLTLRQLNRATLARQLLLERAQLSATAAVEQLAGMQAQEPKPPFIGLWTRLAGFRREELHGALQERAIVRGTLWLVPNLVMLSPPGAGGETSGNPAAVHSARAQVGRSVPTFPTRRHRVPAGRGRAGLVRARTKRYLVDMQ